ncbi:lytic transglycosylase domain-containing protein [Roseicella aquatilis]|uniref:Lytic transglycosylase domain-containing protein n=1 Tax=Roseicella aquatilis TaxID=2527868 RepID=A0A4R4D7R0_9PROT|nr:lytic transglycosylase domain-containing protein [Roseicella aquatilis]TCZ56301.1 lytic transglycosylase domain-containing protein [Roseicella aquatilis]
MRRAVAAIAVVALGFAAPAAGAERPARRPAAQAAAKPAPPPPPLEPRQMCRAGIQQAEQDHRLPTGLLHAIGRVESGRGGTAWPWTINAEGKGSYFDSKEEAIAAVEALQARGVKLIDVGCMQVNLHHHPNAFPDLSAAFDPVANTRYAGLFLKRLYGQTGNWEQAAGKYHSSTPELSEGYKQLVVAAWNGTPLPAGALSPQAMTVMQRREIMVRLWTGGDKFEQVAFGGSGWRTTASFRPGKAAPRAATPLPLLMNGGFYTAQMTDPLSNIVVRPITLTPRRGAAPVVSQRVAVRPVVNRPGALQEVADARR